MSQDYARLEQDRDFCMQRANAAAAKGGAVALGVTTPLVLLLHKFNSSFRKNFGVSGKAAFVVMATCGSCWLSGELEMDRTKKELKRKVHSQSGSIRDPFK